MCKRTLLSRGTLGLGGEANPHQSVLGLKLLHGLGGVVDEGEAGGLAATVLGSETEDGDLVLLGLVEAAELLAELIFGDVGAVGVEDVTEIASSQPKFFPAMPGGPQSISFIKACPHFSSSISGQIYFVYRDAWCTAGTNQTVREMQDGQSDDDLDGRRIGVSDSEGHSHDHLLAAQQRVADELASSEGDGGVVVRHFCRLS